MGRRVNYRFDMERAMELYEKGLVDREIGEQIGVSGSTITRWRREKDLLANGAPIRNPSWRAEVARLYGKGYNDEGIAEQVGVSVQTIHKWRRWEGLPAN